MGYNNYEGSSGATGNTNQSVGTTGSSDLNSLMAAGPDAMQEQLDGFIAANQWYFGPNATFKSYTGQNSADGINAQGSADARYAELLRLYKKTQGGQIPQDEASLKAFLLDGYDAPPGSDSEKIIDARVKKYMASLADWKATQGEQKKGEDLNNVTDELKSYYNMLMDPNGANDKYGRSLAAMASGATTGSNRSRGVQGSLSDLASQQAATQSLAGYQTQRMQLGAQVGGLLSQHTLGIGELQARAQDLRSREKQATYDAQLAAQVSQAQANAQLAQGIGSIFGSVMGGSGGGMGSGLGQLTSSASSGQRASVEDRGSGGTFSGSTRNGSASSLRSGSNY